MVGRWSLSKLRDQMPYKNIHIQNTLTFCWQNRAWQGTAPQCRPTTVNGKDIRHRIYVATVFKTSPSGMAGIQADKYTPFPFNYRLTFVTYLLVGGLLPKMFVYLCILCVRFTREEGTPVTQGCAGTTRLNGGI